MHVIGHLGRDCTTNVVNGKSVINFAIASTEKFRDAQGNMKDKTIWIDAAYWTDRTAIAPYLKKGTQVYVDGNPDLRTYTKNDGTFGASITLRVTNVQLLGSKTADSSGGFEGNAGVESGSGSGMTESNSMSNDNAPQMDDDLPF